jgi:hypothetical protein
VCFTRAGCAGAELAGSADPERSCRAINLTSVATFTAKVFVRSVDVARADWQIPFVTSVVNTYAQAKRVSCSRRARPIRQVEAAANTSFAGRLSNEYTRLGNLSVDLARCYDPGFPLVDSTFLPMLSTPPAKTASGRYLSGPPPTARHDICQG